MRAVKIQRAIPGGAVPAGAGWPRARVTAADPRTLRTVMRPPLARAGTSDPQGCPQARRGLPGAGRAICPPVSTNQRPRASRSCANALAGAGRHLRSAPRALRWRSYAGLRAVPAVGARMPRSAQIRPEVAQRSMIIETWTSPPRTPWGPRQFVIIYRRRHQARSGKARHPLGRRVHVAMNQAGWRPYHATAWR
jgi:hypothetical protein